MNVVHPTLWKANITSQTFPTILIAAIIGGAQWKNSKQGMIFFLIASKRRYRADNACMIYS